VWGALIDPEQVNMYTYNIKLKVLLPCHPQPSLSFIVGVAVFEIKGMERLW
jgi:hypothetical protein